MNLLARSPAGGRGDDVRSARIALVAGLVGTTAMTASTAIETHRRRHLGHPVNYDASEHVADAVGTVLRLPPTTARRRRLYTLVAHWGYGSAIGLAYPPLRTRTDRAVRRQARSTDALAATLLTGATQAMAWVLFPTIGGTPAPRRWSPTTTLSSVVHHAVYGAAFAATYRILDRSRPLREAPAGWVRPTT